MNGMASNYVYDLKEGKNGIFWLATENGLVKFDGYHAVGIPQLTDSTGKNIPVYFVCSMPNSKLWLGTKTGLKIYDPRLQKLIDHPIQSAGPVEDILYIGDNKVLVSFLNDIYLVQTNEDFQPVSYLSFDFEAFESESNIFVSDFVLEKNGSLLMSLVGYGVIKGNINQLGQWDKFELISNPYKSSKNEFSLCKEIIAISPGKWLLNYLTEGLFVYNSHSNDLEKLYDLNVLDNPSFTSATATFIYDGYIYYSILDMGLYRVPVGQQNPTPVPITFKFIPDYNFFDDRISSIYVRNNSLWITTVGGGLKGTSLKPEGLKILPMQENDTNLPSLFSINADDANDLLLATFGKGVFYFKRDSSGVFAVEKLNKNNSRLNLPSDSISEIHFDQQDNLWIGTYQGLCYFTNEKYLKFKSGGNVSPKIYSNHKSNPNSLSSNQVNDIFEDASGNIYATTQSGLNMVDTEKGLIKNSKNPGSGTAFKSESPVFYGEFLGDSSIILFSHWVNGVIQDNLFMSHDYLFPDSYNVNVFHSVTLDSVSWLATNKGLYKYEVKSGKTVEFKEKSFFKNKKINAIIHDDTGTLWMGTNQGIFSYNPTTSIINKYEISGLDNWPFFHYGSVGRDDIGNIYFGTSKGVVQINTHQIPQNSPVCTGSCHIIVSDIVINDKMIAPASFTNPDGYQTIEINEDDVMDILLGYPAHHLEDDIQFEYSINEQKWFPVDPVNPHILLYQLSPGSYNLSIRAVRYGTEVVSASLLPVEVKSPLWLTWWAYVLYALLAGLVFVVYHRYRLSQLKLYQQLELEQVDRMNQKAMMNLKIDFISNVSHEFRTPLTLILNDIDRIKGSSNLAGLAHLNKIEANALRLKRLANELVDVKKLGKEGDNLMVSQHDIVSFARETVQLFDNLAERNNIEVTFRSNESSGIVWFNIDQLVKVLINLLSNAFKFTLVNGAITIDIDCHYLEATREAVAIRVCDKGVGIDEKDVDKIFSGNYSKPPINTSEFESAGIGLRLSKKIVELHKGQIFVTSKKDEGSTFTVVLFKGSGHFEKEQLLKSNLQTSFNQPLANLNITGKRNHKNVTILVVEDDVEIREYIAEVLSCNYTVLEAKSGIDAIELAKVKMPDLIITDLAMPGKDGHAILHEIRNDETTSHIPIIVLTAFTSDKEKIKIFSAGADVHLSKPCDKSVLLVSVQNLLQSRKNLKKMFSASLPDMEELAQKSPDSDLLKRAIAIISKHLSDSYFDVAALAAQLKVSRSLLYQKFPALTNYSPKEFIHVMRVRKGAKLLKSGRYNINEASDEIGYNSPKNFRRYFKSYFGISPSEFIKNNKLRH